MRTLRVFFEFFFVFFVFSTKEKSHSQNCLMRFNFMRFLLKGRNENFTYFFEFYFFCLFDEGEITLTKSNFENNFMWFLPKGRNDNFAYFFWIFIFFVFFVFFVISTKEKSHQIIKIILFLLCRNDKIEFT